MAKLHPAFNGKHILVMVASLVIIIYGVNQAQSVVALLLVSAFLALIGTPPVLWLQRKRVPPALAVMTVMAGMVTLLLMVGGVVGASLSTLSEGLPAYEKRMQEQILALKPLLASKHIYVTNKILLEYLHPGPVMGLVVGLFSGMGLAISNIVLVLLTVAFILLEASSFPIKLRSVLGDPEQVFPQFTKFVQDIKRYMIIKTIISLSAGVILGTWLFILGVDFPVLWGFLAFLLHYIPNIGSILCAIPPVILALVEFGVGSAALTGAGYVVIGFTLGNVVEPRLMGRKLGLSTLVVFLSLIFWGSLLGPIGMVLCIPLTMSMKFALEINKESRWIAVLLGSEKPALRISAAHKKKSKRVMAAN